MTSDQICLTSMIAFALCGLVLLLWDRRTRETLPSAVTALFFAVGCLLAGEIVQLFHAHLPRSCTVPFVLAVLVPYLVTAVVISASHRHAFVRTGPPGPREMY